MCQPVEVRLPEPPTPPSPSTCCLQPVETFFPKKEALPVRSENNTQKKEEIQQGRRKRMEDEEEEQPRKRTLGFSTDLTRKSASLQVSFTQIKPLSKNHNALQFLYLPVAFSLVILSPIVTIKLLKKSWT
jgi:hypothetical protein